MTPECWQVLWDDTARRYVCKSCLATFRTVTEFELHEAAAQARPVGGAVMPRTAAREGRRLA